MRFRCFVFDTCAPNSQLDGTLAPDSAIVGDFDDFDQDVDGSGDHAPHSARPALGNRERRGLPVLVISRAEKLKTKNNRE